MHTAGCQDTVIPTKKIHANLTQLVKYYTQELNCKLLYILYCQNNKHKEETVSIELDRYYVEAKKQFALLTH